MRDAGRDSVTCSGSTAVTCKSGKVTKTTCIAPTATCADGYGCVVCVPGVGISCAGSIGSLCLSDGSGYTTNDCDSELGLTCLGGVCTGDCADVGESYIGYGETAVAATMLNHLLNQGTFYFSVSDRQPGIEHRGHHHHLGRASVPRMPPTIAPGAIWELLTKLPWGPGDLLRRWLPANWGQPPSPATALTKGGAYHIKSTEPVNPYYQDSTPATTRFAPTTRTPTTPRSFCPSTR